MSLSYESLKQDLLQFSAKPNPDSAFKLVKRVSAFVSETAETDSASLGQDLVIRLLDLGTPLASSRGPIDALVREVGLFPYLDADAVSLADKVAMEFHRPEGLNDRVFHRAQAEVFRLLMAGESVILSAPTSFGKSLVVDAVIASGQYRNIVIVVPTLALLDETRRRLSRFRDKYQIITHSAQRLGERNIFIQTQERVIENDSITNVDFFVIDEFYKLNPETDKERAETLNHAFYKLARLAKQFYMLGPNIDAIPPGFKNRYRCTFIKTDYATVASEVHTLGEEERDDKAAVLCKNLSDPTLVYCASPARVRLFADLLLRTDVRAPASDEVRLAAEWIRDNYHPEWSFPTLLEAGIGIHHGRLPRALSQLVVRLFNKGHLRFLVCTSTLIEGVNTKAKNVVILDNKIATKKYDYFTFNNIRGRSGRMLEHFVGHVYLFHQPPQQELPFVDIPVFTQDASASDALLIQVRDEDLTIQSRARLEPYHRQTLLDIETLKANTGIPLEEQLAVAEKLLSNPGKFNDSLNWSRYPNWKQLAATCELLWDCFQRARGKTGVKSGRQLAFYLQKTLQIQSLEEWVAQDNGAGTIDTKIEGALDFIRQWPQYRAPKLLGALNRIQTDVFNKVGLAPGNYEFYIGMLESLGRSPVVVALDEYGIPFQTSEKVWRAIGSPESLDATLEILRHHDLGGLGLTEFEAQLMRDVQPTL